MKTLKEIFGISSKPKSSEESITFHKKMKPIINSLNEVPFKSWNPPAENKWSGVFGQDHSIKEPPFKSNGKKLASGLIMHEPDGRVWLAKPTNGFGGYKHTFPKGKLEPGLHPQANAIKEAYEETGLKGKIYAHAGDAEGDTSVTRYYHATREGGNPLDHGWESEAVVLAHPNNLHKFLNRSRDRIFANKHLNAHMPHLKDE